MIICDYCENYATSGYCDKCPYGSLLEADLRGLLQEYPTEDCYWSKDDAEKELDRIFKMNNWERH